MSSDGIGEFYESRDKARRVAHEAWVSTLARLDLAKARYDLDGTPDLHRAWLEARRIERRAHEAMLDAGYCGD